MFEPLEPIMQHLQKELAALNVGRASAALIEDIQVEAYGTMTPLLQLATITNQGAQQLIIQPWDPGVCKDIERAVRTAGRDFNPVVDGTRLRLQFPPLTEEKRRALVKIVHQRCEDARISVKRVREELMNELKSKKNNKQLSEDDWFGEQKILQKKVDDYNEQIKQLAASKQADIMKL